ncbi:MAG: hypothetical protein QXO37_07030 [Candidatus Nitrosocaldaceae archaeon]
MSLSNPNFFLEIDSPCVAFWIAIKSDDFFSIFANALLQSYTSGLNTGKFITETARLTELDSEIKRIQGEIENLMNEKKALEKEYSKAIQHRRIIQQHYDSAFYDVEWLKKEETKIWEQIQNVNWNITINQKQLQNYQNQFNQIERQLFGDRVSGLPYSPSGTSAPGIIETNPGPNLSIPVYSQFGIPPGKPPGLYNADYNFVNFVKSAIFSSRYISRSGFIGFCTEGINVQIHNGMNVEHKYGIADYEFPTMNRFYNKGNKIMVEFHCNIVSYDGVSQFVDLVQNNGFPVPRRYMPYYSGSSIFGTGEYPAVKSNLASVVEPIAMKTTSTELDYLPNFGGNRRFVVVLCFSLINRRYSGDNINKSWDVVPKSIPPLDIDIALIDVKPANPMNFKAGDFEPTSLEWMMYTDGINLEQSRIGVLRQNNNTVIVDNKHFEVRGKFRPNIAIKEFNEPDKHQYSVVSSSNTEDHHILKLTSGNTPLYFLLRNKTPFSLYGFVGQRLASMI